MNMSEFRKNALHNGWKLGEDGCLYPQNVDMIAEVYYGLKVERTKSGKTKLAVLNGNKISNSKAFQYEMAISNSFITIGGLINCSMNEFLKPEFSAQAYTEEKHWELDTAAWFEFEKPREVINTSEKTVLIRAMIGDLRLPVSQVLIKDGKAVKADEWHLNNAVLHLKMGLRDRLALAEILGVNLGTDEFKNAEFYSYPNGERAVLVRGKMIVLTAVQVQRIKKIPKSKILSVVLNIQDAYSWNKKVYRYKDGTQAVFVDEDKIVITKEQAEEIEWLLM